MNKKTVIIISAIIVICLIIAGLVYAFAIKPNQEKEEGTPKTVEEGRIGKLYRKLSEAEQYTLTRTIDEDNSLKISVKGNTGTKIAIANGRENKYIVKDGNTYLLKDNIKKYYEYLNNEILLKEVTKPLENMKEVTYVSGKEKINKKEYYYEEVEDVQGFLVDTRLSVNNDGKVKTRFYFNGDTLVYVKTIFENAEELLKIDVSEKVDENTFVIPSDYTNAEENKVQDDQEEQDQEEE